jgi:tRNA G18 (ribose-2'-O)-methylase SpoU
MYIMETKNQKQKTKNSVQLNAGQLRTIAGAEAESIEIPRKPMYLVAENVYDTYNIGGLFRLADALAVTELILCGEMEIPPNPRIAKASIGTYKIVPWKYFDTAALAIEYLRHQHENIQIVAVEQSENSRDYRTITYHVPVALMVGNETFGVLPETLALCDEVAELPMWGVNKSLNVIVSAAIAAYHATAQIDLAHP